MEDTNNSRRNFLKKGIVTGTGVIAAPFLLPSSVFSKNGRITPSNKITLACIGVGWMGGTNMERFLEEDDVRIVAVCDVDSKHLKEAKNTVDKKYGNTDCALYHDFRELLTRSDIDAVSLGLPDHWHAIPAITAAEAGKDIYSEKPLSHTLREGQAMRDAVKRYARIWQTGSWQRSENHFRFACEIVRNGLIGKVHTVEVSLPFGHTDFAGTRSFTSITVPPPELDYNFWLGPAPYSPYVTARVHKNWRWYLDFGGGQLMDWVGHHVDIAHWGLGFDLVVPYEIEGKGEFPSDGVWNSPTRYYLTAKYQNDITMLIAGGYPELCDGRGGTKWIGDEGWVWVDRSGMETSPPELSKAKFTEKDIQLYHSPGHYRNFIDCIKSRKPTITPCEVAHCSATPGHLGQISMLLGRKIHFNQDTEEILNDATASEMLGNSLRAPWFL